MQLLIYITKETEKLPAILEGFVEAGVHGATVVDSQGGLQVMYSDPSDDLPPFFGTLRRFLNPQGEAEKMVWLFNEFTRLLGMNPDIEKVIVKLPESGRMESKASRLSHYLDAMVFLGSAKQNPPIACTGVQYRTLHTRSADVLDFVLSKGICRTLHHWDSKIGDAIAAALSGLE